MNWIFVAIDYIFFTCTALTVLYLFTFALASTTKRKLKDTVNSRMLRFVVMFPAYKEDNVIEHSVLSFLKQNYPSGNYDVIVISDKMKDETNHALSLLPIELIMVNFENSSKAKALKFAMNKLEKKLYDGIIILDADNIVENNFLQQINNAFSYSSIAFQTHRKAKNYNTHTAILDSVSEEINNSIFRAGHTRMGLSSALIGSGMVFEYGWFKKNIQQVFSVGEDKEIEALLLQQGIHIEYLENVYVYDEKIQREDAFRQQRLRWLTAQLDSFFRMCKYLPTAIRQRNIDFCDKIFQMIMLPRAIILLIIFFFSLITSILEPIASIKWWILFLWFMFTLRLAIPSHMLNKQLCKASWKIPILGFSMLSNLFRLRGAGKKFIHTEHGEN